MDYHFKGTYVPPSSGAVCRRSDAALIPAEPNCCSVALEELSSALPAAKAGGRNSKWSRAAASQPSNQTLKRLSGEAATFLGASVQNGRFCFRTITFSERPTSKSAASNRTHPAAPRGQLAARPSGGNEPPAGDLRGLSGGSLCCTRGRSLPVEMLCNVAENLGRKEKRIAEPPFDCRSRPFSLCNTV